MKTAVVRHPFNLQSLRIEDRPAPSIAAGLVKVRWHALSLNFHDYAVVTGIMPTTDDRRPTTDGRIPVSDGAGEVVEVGDGVIDWNIGDRVLSTFFPDWRDGEPTMANTRRLAGESTDGCAAEFSLCLPESLTTIPRQYSYLEAATLPCAGLTAWRAMLEIGRIKAGDSVLVQGSGGASIFALQFARAMGAKVFATSSSAEKGHRLRELGADEVVNYQNDTNWGKTICALAGEGVDHVVDIWGRLNSDELDRRCPRGGQRSSHRHAGGALKCS